MKVLIFATAIIIFTGCASTSANRKGMLIRAVSHVPQPTRTKISSIGTEATIKLANSGMQKLQLEDLYRYNQLNLKIIRSSRENCLAVINATSEKEKTFKVLDDQEYDDYAKIIAKTISLGANFELKEFPRPSKSAFEKAIDIALSAPPSGLSKIEPEGLEHDQCWTMEKVRSYIDEKRNTAAETLVRYISSY